MIRINNFIATARKPMQVVLILIVCLLPTLLSAQSGVEGTLTTIKDWVVAIVNIVFVIAIVVGIIRTIIAFISGNSNAVRYLVYLIIAVLVWFGFSVLIDDFSGLGGIGNIG